MGTHTNMVTLTIDGKRVTVPVGTTILAAARTAGLDLPTLCYFEGLNDVGACRICVVELIGQERLAAACNTPVEEGMDILTHSHRVREARRINIALLMSRHECRCLTCVRSGNCALQDLARNLGVVDSPYEDDRRPARAWDPGFPLQRDPGKCVQCCRCVAVCDKIQGLGVWSLTNYGARQDIAVSGGRDITAVGGGGADCALCGQCVTHCPTGALWARDDTARVFAALADPSITTVIQTAPAVRSAWAETLGLPSEAATPGKLAAALRALGFDYVFDTDFAADLTIMEEGTEFIERVLKPRMADGADAGGGAVDAGPDAGLPMFTSCCPGWVRFVKARYPRFAARLSSAKSPQQMFGAVAKTYFAEKRGVDPSKIFVASVMPCVAKKYEAALPEMSAAGAGPDVDAALTTRELARMLRADGIAPSGLPEEAFDDPLGEGSGAGVIFGESGGVMDAALRTVYHEVMGKNPPPDTFRSLRQGRRGVVEASFTLGRTGVRVAVVSGLANAARLLDALERGDARYDFVEVMACPGGCAGGGGQPIHRDREAAEERGALLSGLDARAPTRFSHENASVRRLYEEFLERPGSHKAHGLLHTR